MMKQRALAFLVAAALVPVAYAGVIDTAPKAQSGVSSQTWSAWGGQIGVRWNTDLLGNLGVALGKAPTSMLSTQDFRRHQWFGLRESGGLQFTVGNGSLREFTGGTLQMRGGYVLTLRDGSTIDLRDMMLRVRANDHKVLDVVSADGKVWFYSDRIMFELANGNRSLAVRAADLRIAPALANRIGVPDAAGWEIADLAMNTEINVEGADIGPARVCSPYPWPGVDVPGQSGATYQADLFMQSFSVSPVGCQNCDGSGGNDGIASLAPSSTLRNNVNDGSSQPTISGDPLGTSSALYTANVAWYTMFSGTNPPYGNDQHPFLIWNLYRVDADGSIEQIGRSGVKHAFLTINAGCLDSCFDSHSLGLGCGDTYGTGNNDSPGDMGPRSEIVPATGTWGRCGSIWDPSCTGTEHSNGNNSWTQRLQTHESQIDPAVNTGATYMFESWYLAREDINIYNSMATVTGTPHYSSGTWSLSGQTNYKLGPAIDRWVDPANTTQNQFSGQLAAPEGHAKVAVKVTDLGNGNWRYDYAVMNLDFARAVVEAPDNGPDPRVLSNKGFDSFSVPFPSGASVVSTTFHDGDLDGSNDWAATTDGNHVTWAAGSGQPTLDWGTMYSFSVVVSAPPQPSLIVGRRDGGVTYNGHATLHVAQTGSPASYKIGTLVPGHGD